MYRVKYYKAGKLVSEIMNPEELKELGITIYKLEPGGTLVFDYQRGSYLLNEKYYGTIKLDQVQVTLLD